MKPRIEPLEDRLAPALSCFADVTASFSAAVVPNPEWSDTTAMVADDAIALQQILQPSNFATSLGDYPSIDAAVIADDAAVMQKAYDSENSKTLPEPTVARHSDINLTMNVYGRDFAGGASR